MGMRRLFLTLAVLGTTVAAAEPTHPCRALDDAGREELLRWVHQKYPRSREDISFCPAVIAAYALRSQPTVAGDCLEKIFRDGLEGSGFWEREEPAPKPAEEVLGGLARFDKPRAARLWHEWGDAPERKTSERLYARVE